MNRREYLESIDMYANTYRYWIEENEPRGYAHSAGLKGEQEALEELEGLYEFFELKEGVRANGFAQRVKKELAGIKYDAVYFDEDVIDTTQSGGMAEALRRFTGRGVLNKRRRAPFFKPDFSPDTLRSFYYPGGLTLISHELAERIAAKNGIAYGEKADAEISGNSRSEKFSYGSAEFLRECLLEAKEVLHIPQVLYHTYVEGDIEYEDTEYGEESGALSFKDDSITEETEQVSCVILSKDNPDLLKKCIEGLRESEKAEGLRINIGVVDNGSSDENRILLEALGKKLNFKYIYEKSEFVYSRLNNLGASVMKEKFPDNKYLLFLNDDIEIPEGTFFLRKMMDTAGREHVGVVGVKLLYPDEISIQHVGVTLLKSGPSHKLNGYSDEEEYYHGVNVRDINVFSVTGACLMLRRELFEVLRGFDEAYAVGYTDTELCVRLLVQGYYNVCLNSVYLIHHEGASRGNDLASRNATERLLGERRMFYSHFGDFLRTGDPFYSPNLTDTELDYTIRARLPGKDIPLSGVEEINEKYNLKVSQGEGGKLKYSLDYCGYELNDEYGNGNFYDIKGWAFIDGSKGYDYEKRLLLKQGDKVYRVKAYDTYREDVPEVFSRKGLYLSGFEAKIISSELKEGVYTVALALIKNKTNKGYCREDICRIETV
ncbi:MAG: glycosyltransferase [Lachnospiraceae bacterium]|nr:glycosyltransferase [Lachnospiraceae bacterium]